MLKLEYKITLQYRLFKLGWRYYTFTSCHGMTDLVSLENGDQSVRIVLLREAREIEGSCVETGLL